MTKPILFSTPMVQAILDGRKTQTRRILKPQPDIDNDVSFMPNPPLDWQGEWFPYRWETEEGEMICKNPKYCIGDILWVLETFTIIDWWEDSKAVQIMYEDAKTLVKTLTDIEWAKFENWKDKSERKPSLFLFKSLSRIFLEVTNVRAERLVDISEDDAIAEGINCWDSRTGDDYQDYYENYLLNPKDDLGFHFTEPIPSYCSLWEKINGIGSWEANPYVWVIEFKQVDKPITP